MRASIRGYVRRMVLAVLLFALPAAAQVNLGRLSGNVTDETGGVMAGAKVSVIDQDRGTTRVLTTDEAGAYAAPSLTPGNYTVRVEATGFNTSERKDIQVPVGGDIRADMVMKAGSQTQTVTVTEALPLINTTAATLGGVMQGHEVADLPLIAHNYQTLLQFQPGVMSKPGGGANAHSSNGARSDGNNWLFEGMFSGGVRTAGIIVNQNSSTGDGASVVPPDAIQEMGISFQNKAEYGWKPGVASNVGVKSGTNSIHGTAFAVGQTDALNARNPFNPPPDPKPELNYQQYGATIGGPIKKDKLFYFVGFEGIRFIQGTPTTHKTPTTAFIAGDLVNSIPAAYLDLRNRKLAGTLPACGGANQPSCSLYAFDPNAIDANGNVVNAAGLTPAMQLSAQLIKSGIFQNGVPNSKGVFAYGFTAVRDPSKNIVGKINYQLGDKHQISGVYFWSKDTEIGNSESVLQPYWTTDYYLTANVLRFNWTYLPNSAWVNEFHFGFDRKVENQWGTECRPGRTVPPPNYAFNTGVPGCTGAPNPSGFALPSISINGFDSLGSGGGQRRVEGYPAWADNVSYTAGNHNMKFGFEARHPYWNGASFANLKGTVNFGSQQIHAFSGATSLQDFLMGLPSTASYVVGDPVITRRYWAYGAFVQDDWRVTPRLTINLGLRYEYETALTEDHNLMAVFDPLSPTGLTQIGNGVKSWQPNLFASNLQPRTGVVWDITGKGTTVVRAGWGIYSNWPVLSVVQGLGSNPSGALFYRADGTTVQGTGTIVSASNVTLPTVSGVLSPGINWTAAGPVFPTGTVKCGDNLTVQSGPNAGTKNPGTCAIGMVDPHWSVPYMHQWNVSLQRALGSAMSLDIAYVGSHGTNLFGTNDLNMPAVGDNSSTRVQQSRPYYSRFPWFGNILQVTNRDWSNYNGLQLTFNQRSWHGLTSTVGYTFSHTLDVAGTDLAQAVYPDVRCPSCNYGPTPFDIRHRLTARLTYNLPELKGYAQMLEGWSIASVVNLQGATPWDTRDSSSNFSGTGKAERWNLIGDPKVFNSFGRFDHVPCFGVAAGPSGLANRYNGSLFGTDLACTGVTPGGNQLRACSATVTTNCQDPAILVANMPKACLAAADSLPVNPAVPFSSGRASLLATGCYMVGESVIVPPAQGTFGNMGKGIFRSSAFRNWDISVRKNFRFVERLSAQFLFDMYNVTNTPHFAIPGGNGNTSANDLTTPSGFGASAATPNVSNGNVVGGSGDARRYQFGLKLTF